MPIHAFTQDRFLQEKGLTNYWGYNTLAFFAPEQRYFATDSQDELRRAVRRLHAAGIEVILDVVYNHTCEGSEKGPTLSWRGLDNATYYRLRRRRRALRDQRHRHRQHAQHSTRRASSRWSPTRFATGRRASASTASASTSG